MTDIYEQHEAAFPTVSAFVVVDQEGQRVATVAIRFPTRGLRLWAYVHLIGVPMTRGSASGGGYDKSSAAVAAAIAKVEKYDMGYAGQDFAERINTHREKLQRAGKATDHGDDWNRTIEREGFRVFQAV